MATVHSVNIKANLDAKQAQQEAEKLHKTIKATKAEAASMHTSSGGQASLNAAKKSQAAPGSELTQYGNTRAMRPGGTGASARDFAQEAQGLGGLVRLYATYAANVFAVSAAFTALSAAQDTANMVMGLNQLGAASGVALGSLSKDLVKATDGAVSLREAMEATVKAQSSGMSSKDILRMGEVAKKASQALGVDMSDALSRISRGITKLEPELLDELGIFTRIDPAVQAYAKSVNKSVSDLSQFERQMAFSNAVLEEGERKFSAINIETNAYTQLLAKLKDAATTIGDALNTVLVPLVKILQSSPTALFTLIGAMALMVTKQAIPAFANMRKAMLDNMTQVGEIAKEKQKGLTTYMDTLAANAKKVSYKVMEDTDNMLAASQTKLAEYEKKMGKRGITAPSKQFLDANANNPITTQLVKDLETQAKNAEKNKQNNAKLYRELADTAAAHYEKEQNFQKTALEDANKRISKTLEYKAAVLELQQTQNVQTKASIINAATEKANIEGLRAGYRVLRDDIRTKREEAEIAKKEVKEGNLANVGATGFGKVAAGVTLVSGAFSLLSGVISKGISIVAPYLELLALLGIAFAMFDQYMDKTTEQAGKFRDALDSLKDSNKTFVENLDRLDTLKISDFFNPDTIKGTSTAIITVADNIQTLGQKFEKLQAAQADSWWAKTKDSFASLWGGDIKSKFTQGVSESITSLLKSLEKAPAKFKTAQDAIAKLTGVSDPTNLVDMEKALEGMDPKSEKFKELQKILQQLKVDAGNLATDVTAFKTSLTEFGDATQSLANQFIDKDPLTTFALKGLTASDKLQKALKGELVGAVSAIGEALDDLGKKPLFGSGADIARLGKMKVSLEEVQKALVDNEREIKELTEQRNKLQKETPVDVFDINSTHDLKVEALSLQIKAKEQQLVKARAKAPQMVSEIQELSTKGANSFIDILDAKIALTMAKGGQAFMGAVAGALGNLPGVATMKANAQLADIGFQQNLIKLQMQMLEQQTLSRINQDILVQEAEVNRIQLRDPDNATGAVSAAVQKLDKMKQERTTLVKTKDPREILALSKDKVGDTASTLRDYALAKAGMHSQLKSLGDQAAGINFTKKTEELGAEVDARKKILDINKQSNTEIISTIELQEKLNGGAQNEEILRKSNLTQENIRLDTQKEILDNLSRQSVLDLAIGSGVTNEKAKQQALDEKLNLNKQLQNIYAKSIRELAQEEYNTKLRILENAKKEEAFIVNKLDLAEQTKKTLESTKLNTYETSISNQKDYGVDTSAQDLQLQSLKDAEAFRAQAAETELAKRKEIFDLQQRQAAITNKDSTEYTRLTEIINLTNQKYATITAGEIAAKAASDSRLLVQQDILNTTREQAAATRSVQEASESLAVVFGSVGEAAGGLLTTLYDVAKGNAANEVSVRKAGEAANTAKEQFGENSKEYIAAKKEESLAIKKSTKDELAGNLSVLSSAKKMFGEKTIMHKGLGAIEKLMHMQRLAAMAAELPATIANTAAQVTAMLPSVLAQYVSQIPAPFGWVLGGAAVAALAAMVGGSAPSTGFNPTSAQRQETQGTAMGWDSNGNKVQTSRGVFGDTDAKTQSIVNSLEIIRDNSVDGLSYDNKMLRALENLSTALDNTAKGIYGVRGISAGSLTNIVEGTNTSGGVLGISGLFGKSTSKETIDSGLKLSGTFSELMRGAQGTISVFETISTTVKKSGFFGIGGSTKTSVNTQFKELQGLDTKAFNQLVSAFKYAGDTLYSIADMAGVQSGAVQSVLDNIRVDEMASLRGLTGEEFTKELQQVIGSMLDSASLAIFSNFEQYAKFGEGMLETVVRRVVDSNTKVNQALKNIGIDLEGTLQETGVSYNPEVLKQQQIAITESLVSLAGGLDSFLDKADFFRKNFLTAEEQLVPIQKAVTTELGRLAKAGFNSADGLVDTREEFKSLVLGLDLTTLQGRETYTSLMNVSEGFYQMTEDTQTALQNTIDKFKAFQDGLKSFRDNLILGNQSPLTPAQRYAESRRQFDEVSRLALGGDETAQGKLQNTAQTFLTASKEYNASGSTYTADFNTVLDVVNRGISDQSSQVSLAERQLNGTTAQVALLQTISTDIGLLVNNPSNIPGLAQGGLGRGITLVGETGPELVDFTNPGRVYTAEQTQGMFNNQPNMTAHVGQLVSEMKQVRQEIAQLRKEQQQQTGALISSNYDANNRAADTITKEVAEASAAQEWQLRNKVIVL